MKFIYLVAMFFFILSSPASAAQKSVTVDWSYTPSRTGLAGFRVYKDGVVLATVNDPAARTLTFSMDISATLTLTMTAFYSDGKEDTQSLIKIAVDISGPSNLRVLTTP